MIIGHKHQLRYLERLINTGRTPHALIFAGPEHIGKRLLAETLLGQGSADTYIVERFHEKSEITIEQIRELRRFAALSPFNSPRKLALIDGGERMNREGMNALLKTLEDPFPHTIFIITTSRMSRLPKTIISRSLVIKFEPVSQEEMLAGGLKIPTGEWDWIAGRPGLALRFRKDPNDEAVRTRREAFISVKKIQKSSLLSERLHLAEKLAADDFLTVLDGIALALRDKTEILKRLGILRELFEITTLNKRLQFEEILLMI